MRDASVQKLELPASLNSYHRFYAHKIAEQFCLEHQSHGEGWERRLVLQKTGDTKVDLVLDMSEGDGE